MSHTIRGRVLPVLAGAAIIAATADVSAYAANGHAVLLGRAQAPASHSTASTPGQGSAPRAFHYVLPRKRQLGVSFRLTGLPKGTYLASYQVATVNNDPAESPTFCALVDGRSRPALISFGVPGPAPTAPGEDQIEISSATGLVVVKHRGQSTLECADGDRLFTAEGSENSVTLTPVAGVSKGHVKDVASRTSSAFAGH